MMKKIKLGTLRFNVFSMFFSNVLFALYYWLQLMLISKNYDLKTLGFYTFSLAVIIPLYKLTNMQLRSLLITDTASDCDFSLSDYFLFRLISLFIFLLLAIMIYCFINIDPVIYFFLLAIKFVEGIADIVNANFQKIEKMHFVSISVALKSILGIIGFSFGIYLDGLFLAFLLCFVLNSLVLIFYDLNKFLKKNKISFSLNSEVVKKIFFTSFPLAVTMLIISAQGSISKFFLEYFEGTELQGVYSSIEYVVILGSIIINAIGQAFAPRLSLYYGSNQIESFLMLIKKYFLFNALLGLLGILVSLFLGKYVLMILFNNEIAKYTDLFILMTISALFLYIRTAFGYMITAMRRFELLPRINILSLILTVLFGYFFIIYYGLKGAVISSVIVGFLNCAYSFYLVNKSLAK